MDVFEVIVLQDIINSDRRVINEKAIKALVNEAVNIIKKCTNNYEGQFYCDLRDVQLPNYNSNLLSIRNKIRT
jgi:hypothetical protein